MLAGRALPDACQRTECKQDTASAFPALSQ